MKYRASSTRRMDAPGGHNGQADTETNERVSLSACVLVRRLALYVYATKKKVGVFFGKYDRNRHDASGPVFEAFHSQRLCDPQRLCELIKMSIFLSAFNSKSTVEYSLHCGTVRPLSVVSSKDVRAEFAENTQQRNRQQNAKKHRAEETATTHCRKGIN